MILNIVLCTATHRKRFEWTALLDVDTRVLPTCVGRTWHENQSIGSTNRFLSLKLKFQCLIHSWWMVDVNHGHCHPRISYRARPKQNSEFFFSLKRVWNMHTPYRNVEENWENRFSWMNWIMRSALCDFQNESLMADGKRPSVLVSLFRLIAGNKENFDWSWLSVSRLFLPRGYSYRTPATSRSSLNIHDLIAEYVNHIASMVEYKIEWNRFLASKLLFSSRLCVADKKIFKWHEKMYNLL